MEEQQLVTKLVTTEPCLVPIAILSYASPELLAAMPTVVAANSFASQMYVATALEVEMEKLTAPPAWRVSKEREDLNVLKHILKTTQPGDWKAPKTALAGLPCMSASTNFTIHPKANKRYALTGSTWVGCCGCIPCPCSTTMTGHIEEDGTSQEWRMSDGTHITGILSGIDMSRRIVSYSLSGTGPNGAIHGTQDIDANAMTNTMRWSDARVVIAFVSRKIEPLGR